MFELYSLNKSSLYRKTFEHRCFKTNYFMKLILFFQAGFKATKYFLSPDLEFVLFAYDVKPVCSFYKHLKVVIQKQTVNTLVCIYLYMCVYMCIILCVFIWFHYYIMYLCADVLADSLVQLVSLRRLLDSVRLLFSCIVCRGLLIIHGVSCNPLQPWPGVSTEIL